MKYATLAVLGILASALVATAQTTTWIGPNDGDWFDDANWSAGVPDSTQFALFNGAGTSTLQLDRTPVFARGVSVLGGDLTLRAVDFLGDLRLRVDDEEATTIDVANRDSRLSVYGDIAAGSAQVRNGGALVFDGRVTGLSKIALANDIDDPAELTFGMVDLGDARIAVNFSGAGVKSLTFRESVSPLTRLDFTGSPAEIVLDRAKVGNLTFNPDDVTQRLSLRLNHADIQGYVNGQGVDVTVTGNSRVLGRSAGFQDELSLLVKSSFHLDRDASLEIDAARGISGDFYADWRAKFAAYSSSTYSTALFRQYIQWSGSTAYFGPGNAYGRLHAQPSDFRGRGFTVTVSDHTASGEGFQLLGAGLEVIGSLRLRTPVVIGSSVLKQRGGYSIRPFSGNPDASFGALVFEGLVGDWGDVPSTVISWSAVRAGQMVVLRDVDLTATPDYEEVLQADICWIGDGVFRLLPLESTAVHVPRLSVKTLLIGGWAWLDRGREYATTNQPAYAMFTGVGEIRGEVRNGFGGRIDPGLPLGAMWIEGDYVQQFKWAPAPPYAQGHPQLRPRDHERRHFWPGALGMQLQTPEPETGHDVLEVTGDAFLGGLLDLQFVDEQEPANGDYELIRAGRIIDQFESVKSPPLSAGRSAQVIYTQTSVIVRIGVLGDVNGDGVVNGRDIAAWVALAKDNDPAADINGDGEINGGDLAAILSNWTGQ